MPQMAELHSPLHGRQIHNVKENPVMEKLSVALWIMFTLPKLLEPA